MIYAEKLVKDESCNSGSQKKKYTWVVLRGHLSIKLKKIEITNNSKC